MANFIAEQDARVDPQMSEGPSHKIVSLASRSLVPFGGAYGWVGDLTVSRRVGQAKSNFVKASLVIESYYVAEPDERRAMIAIRTHADAGKDAELTVVRSLSRKEVERLGLKPGQVKVA
jgi:hypothetical protein